MSDPKPSYSSDVSDGAVGMPGGEFVVPGITPRFNGDEVAADAEADQLDLDLDVEEDEGPAAGNLADLDEENLFGKR